MAFSYKRDVVVQFFSVVNVIDSCVSMYDIKISFYKGCGKNGE